MCVSSRISKTLVSSLLAKGIFFGASVSIAVRILWEAFHIPKAGMHTGYCPCLLMWALNPQRYFSIASLAEQAGCWATFAAMRVPYPCLPWTRGVEYADCKRGMGRVEVGGFHTAIFRFSGCLAPFGASGQRHLIFRKYICTISMEMKESLREWEQARGERERRTRVSMLKEPVFQWALQWWTDCILRKVSWL